MLEIEKYPHINGEDRDSFAGFTITNRLPAIINDVIINNYLSNKQIQNLRSFQDQIQIGTIEYPICHVRGHGNWEQWMEPYIGKTWFEIPFYAAESYFYQCILEIIDFNENGIDPYHEQKKQDIATNLDQFHNILSLLQQHELDSSEGPYFVDQLFHTCLWGNKSDLSQLQINRETTEMQDHQFTLVDDSRKIYEVLSGDISRIDIILDNAGLELFTDLLLAVYLITIYEVRRIYLHTKSAPTFVSDATSEDIRFLMNYLSKHGNNLMSSFIHSLEHLISSGKIILQAHHFWNSPLHFFEMPQHLLEQMKTSDLIIFKGDANYRRIFGDRIIPFDKDPGKFAGYLPAKSVSVRILKSEIMLGLTRELISNLMKHDETWVTNGRYGIIQLLS